MPTNNYARVTKGRTEQSIVFFDDRDEVKANDVVREAIQFREATPGGSLAVFAIRPSIVRICAEHGVLAIGDVRDPIEEQA